MEVMKVEEALKSLRNQEKRKFIQTVDLIVNLKNFDPRKESINSFVQVPNPSEKKICGFLTKKSSYIDTVTKEQFEKFKKPSEIKKFAKKYDFFIASAGLMGAIATTFGRILGPMGKMPSPQAGIMPVENDASIKQIVDKMKRLVRVRTKEKSIKLPVGKEDLPDEKLKENIESVLKSVEGILPRNKENINNVLIKLTMSKPARIR